MRAESGIFHGLHVAHLVRVLLTQGVHPSGLRTSTRPDGVVMGEYRIFTSVVLAARTNFCGAEKVGDGFPVDDGAKREG